MRTVPDSEISVGIVKELCCAAVAGGLRQQCRFREGHHFVIASAAHSGNGVQALAGQIAFNGPGGAAGGCDDGPLFIGGTYALKQDDGRAGVTAGS